MLYIDFMREQMNEHPFGDTFLGDVNKFIIAMLPSEGFAKWLNSIRGESLTTVESQLLVDTYIKYGERQPSDIPAVFRLIERQYDIEFDIPHQWYQAEHWQAHYAQ